MNFRKSPTSKEVAFDPLTSGMTSTDANSAIIESYGSINTSASPGFGFGRSGNITRGSYLYCEGVPSNVVGRYVYINTAAVRRVFVGNENLGTFTFEVLSHDINEVNLSLLGSVTVSAAYGATFSVNWSVTTGKFLAVRVAAASTDAPKNVVFGLELRGTV